MNADEFVAQRREVFLRVDEELRPFVEDALARYVAGEADWYSELVDGASVIWTEVYQSEAPNADASGERYEKFRDDLSDALERTSDPGDSVDPAQVERVTLWLGTYVVNNATFNAVGARGGRYMRWTSMRDVDVRETHRITDGQIAPIGGTFDVGGFNLHYPGEPVGPPEIWINCRCLLQAAARRGETNVSPTTFAIADEEVVAVEEEDLPIDELEDDEEEITEIPVHGVLAPEGVPTGDGRQFAEGALSNRNLPLPIAYQLLSGEGHDGSATVGRIDEIFREGNEVRFRGMLVLTKEHTSEVVEGIIDGTVRGISVDVDDIEVDMSSVDAPETESGKMQVTVFSHARIAGVTIVPIPAFQEAFISLGHEFADELSEAELALLASCGCEMGGEPGLVIDDDDEDEEVELDNPNIITSDDVVDVSDDPEANARAQREAILAGAEFAPGTKDGPGWITHPVPTARIRRYWTRGKGAAKIKWGAPGDFNRCRRQLAKYIKNPQWLAGACANMHKEALGIWPGQHRGHLSLVAGGQAAPVFNFVAAARRVFDSNLFARVELENPRVGVIVDDDDLHVYGYMAQWGVCHIGIDGICTTAPPSQTDYWYYATGVVDTTDGEIRVGQITMDTGHASLKASAKVAAAHYDNTGAAVADVHVGEDAFGIWFSGVLRPTITDDQLHALRASSRISGDWRLIGGNLEMVAGLVVNVPGLPIPHTMVASAEGVQTALVAAGVTPPIVEPAVTAGAQRYDANELAGIVRTAIDEYRHAEKREARTAPIRATLRQKRLATLREKMKEG